MRASWKATDSPCRRMGARPRGEGGGGNLASPSTRDGQLAQYWIVAGHSGGAERRGGFNPAGDTCQGWRGRPNRRPESEATFGYVVPSLETSLRLRQEGHPSGPVVSRGRAGGAGC